MRVIIHSINFFMWTPITDCSKQIVARCRLKEENNNYTNIYEMVMIEFDQYHLKLISRNDKPCEEQGMVLKCEQLLKYKFEIETS